MMLIRVGNKYVHLLKMFGALFSFASAFFVLNSAYNLNVVLSKAKFMYPAQSAGDIFGMLTGPLASLFLWLAFLVLGLALYRSDRTVFPLEEDIRDYPDIATPQVPKRKVAAKKKK